MATSIATPTDLQGDAAVDDCIADQKVEGSCTSHKAPTDSFLINVDVDDNGSDLSAPSPGGDLRLKLAIHLLTLPQKGEAKGDRQTSDQKRLKK